jgi:hypothetical protein
MNHKISRKNLTTKNKYIIAAYIIYLSAVVVKGIHFMTRAKGSKRDSLHNLRKSHDFFAIYDYCQEGFQFKEEHRRLSSPAYVDSPPICLLSQ